MAPRTINQKKERVMEVILEELQVIKQQLDKFLLLIPEERLREYKNAHEIRKSYLEAIKSFPPT